jgi:hypothetical protein
VILRGVWSQTGQRIVAYIFLRRRARDNAVMPIFSANDPRAIADGCATLQGHGSALRGKTRGARVSSQWKIVDARREPHGRSRRGRS